jgi:replication factor A1
VFPLPSDEDIASTIEELARKLDDVAEDEIREELQRYLDHGVPLHQAKRDLEQTLPQQSSDSSGATDPSPTEDKKLGDITTSDENVNVRAKVLSVDERQVTARGEEKTIWSGELGDETGVRDYTSWRNVGLEEGQVLEIENAYVTEWRDAPQINVGDHAEVTEIADSIEVPDDARPKTAGEIGELEAGMSAVTITGRVLSKDSREVEVRGEPQTLWEGEIADGTGRIPYTAWEEFDFGEDDVLTIDNAYVRSFRGVPQLNFGDNADVTHADHDAVPSKAELAETEGPDRATEERQVRDLSPGDSSVKLTGRVLDRSEREITSDGETQTLWEGEIADETGRIPYTAWEEFDFAEGDVVTIDNAYVRSFRGLPQLNFGDNADVRRGDDDALPPQTELARPREATIAELQRAQGAVGARLEAAVIEIRDGSGLIFRCPECRRVLREGECNRHGEVDGIADLRIKAVVDDGTGGLTALFDRPTTERLLDLTLEEARDEARREGAEAIDAKLAELILMKPLRLDGNATHDEYGTQFVVNDVEIVDHGDVEAEAEQMIDEVHALAEEVAA